MILIVVKFNIRPDRSEDWLSLVEEFTAATRQEEGNLFFEWSRSIDNSDQFVLVEAFASAAAGAVHVKSEHFRSDMEQMPPELAATTEIVNVEVPGSGWSVMSELAPTERT